MVEIVLGFVASVLIARSLGPEGKGYYSLIFSTAALLVTFTGLSLASGVFYYASRETLHYRRLYAVLLVVTLVQVAIVLGGLRLLRGTILAEAAAAQHGAIIGALAGSPGHIRTTGAALCPGAAQWAGAFCSVSLKSVSTRLLASLLLWWASLRQAARHPGNSSQRCWRLRLSMLSSVCVNSGHCRLLVDGFL